MAFEKLKERRAVEREMRKIRSERFPASKVKKLGQNKLLSDPDKIASAKYH